MKDALLILLLGVAVAWLAKRFGLPAAVAQVLLGLIIGPPLLGWIAPGTEIQLIGELGVVLLLGIAGFHLGLGHLRKAGLTGVWVALLGMVFSLVAGYGFATWWGSSLPEAVYIGATLTATSIGISVQVLQQYHLINRRVGKIVVAAAIIDDVLALYLLAIAHGSLSGELVVSQIVISVLFAAVLFTVIFIVSLWFSRLFFTKDHILKPPVKLVAAVVVIVFCAWITEISGYSLVVGSFFAGLGLGEGMSEAQRSALVKQFEVLVFLLVPFFFVYIGSSAQWQVLSDPGMPLLVIGLVIISIVGKTLGGFIGAYNTPGYVTPLLIGVSMVPRGEVALVIAGLGFEQGHISHHVLVALILMTISAALLGPLMMAPLSRRKS